MYPTIIFSNKIRFIICILLIYTACTSKSESAYTSLAGTRYDRSTLWEKKLEDIHPYYTDYRFPLEEIHKLAGNFGEIRSGHFHSGLDIKVDGKVGMPILAAQDGYIYRVLVSPFGYGKAIYLRHPDGYTTVYGHLSRFTDKLEKKVKAQQYKLERFGIDIFPRQEKIWVKKGDIIAYSGNTGSSLAPHLHFEIRDIRDNYINPLPFFKNLISDTQAPLITSLAICPLDSFSSVNQKTERYFITPTKEKNNYVLKQPIYIDGKIGIEYLAYDIMDETSNKFGIYTSSLYLDDSLQFQYTVPKFSEDEQKYVDLHTVYELPESYEKCYLVEGNSLNAYKSKKQGVISLTDDKIHPFKLVLADIYGNKTSLLGQLQRKSFTIDSIPKTIACFIGNLSPYKSFFYKTSEIYLTFPKTTVFTSFPLSICTEPKTEGLYSMIYKVGNPAIPLDGRYEIRFKLPQSILKKAVITYLQNNKWTYLGGKIEKDSFIVSRCHIFGTFAVLADTISPEIKPLNFNLNDLLKTNTLLVHISDDFSGIVARSIRGTIDGKWVLWEYDAKTGNLTHNLDETLTKGEHSLTLNVSDNVGNKTTFNGIIKK